MNLDPDLQPFFQKVHQSPVPVGWTFGPVGLVRAVNALQSLGPERALLVLRAYASQAETDVEAAKRLGLDASRVLLIIRLLFVPRERGETLPPLILGRPDVHLPERDAAWPHLPLVLSQDLPFLPVGGYFLAGALRSSLEYLDEYAEQGRLRDVPLLPQVSPVEAVESLLGSPDWRRLIPSEQEPRVRAMLFGQALRAAEPAYPVDEALYRALAISSLGELGRLWERHAAALRALRLGWDSSVQAFRSGR